MQPHHVQPTTASDGLQNSMSARDEIFGFSGIEQCHGTAVAYTGDRTTYKQEDIQMDIERHQLKNGIHVRSDVNVQ